MFEVNVEMRRRMKLSRMVEDVGDDDNIDLDAGVEVVANVETRF